MLAAWTNYTKAFQIPLMLAFLAGWLLLGGWLFQRSLRKHTEKRRVKFGRGVLLAFLSGLFGGMTGGAMLLAGRALFGVISKELPVPLWGIIIGLLGFLLVSYLVVYAITGLSSRQSLTVTVLPISGLLLLSIVIGISAFVPALYMVRHERAIQELELKTKQRIALIYNAIRGRGVGQQPETLQQLVDDGDLEPGELLHPANPDGGVGFLYLPEQILWRDLPEGEQPIQICDKEPHDYINGEGRIHITLPGGSPEFTPESQFRQRLKSPENAPFAEAILGSQDE